MKLFIATPAYDRKVCIQTALALLDERIVAHEAGVAMDFGMIPGASVITEGRNELLRQFIEGDADKIVFVDADVSWPPGTLTKLALHPVDWAGGAYRFKMDDEGYPVQFLDGQLWADPDTGLLEVAAVPGGFLAISREAVLKLRDAHPERAYTHFGQSLHAWFCVPFGGSEDGFFCADWRNHGGKVWLDPELTLTHHDGPNAYTGKIGDWLRAKITPEMAEAARQPIAA